jgi:hypothetical protein
LDFIPWLILFLGVFIFYMTTAYSLVVALGVGFSLLPLWRPLHDALFHKKSAENESPSSSSHKSRNKDVAAGVLRGISLFAFMIAFLNVFVMASGFHSYYIDHGAGKVVKIDYRDVLILEDGQRISHPVDFYEVFPALKPIELGDDIEKTSGSLEFFVNSNVYFNNEMFWEQELNSHSFIFLIGDICIGLVLATIFKILYPDELLNYFDTSNRGSQNKEQNKEEKAEIEPHDSAQSREHYDPKNDLDSVSGEYLEFSQNASNSISRTAICIIAIFLFFFCSLIMNIYFSFYLVGPLALIILFLIIATILRSGLNKLLIHQKRIILDTGVGFMRKRKHHMKKKKPPNKFVEYLILFILCAIPCLSVLGFLMLFLDMNSPLIFNAIGITAAVGIAVFTVVVLGFKGILFCFAFSLTWVGFLSSLISLVSDKVKTLPSLIAFTLGLGLWGVKYWIYKRDKNK